MTHNAPWTKIKEKNGILLRRRPVTTSRSGRNVYEYQVWKGSENRVVWGGMSKQWAYKMYAVSTMEAGK